MHVSERKFGNLDLVTLINPLKASVLHLQIFSLSFDSVSRTLLAIAALHSGSGKVHMAWAPVSGRYGLKIAPTAEGSKRWTQFPKCVIYTSVHKKQKKLQT